MIKEKKKNTGIRLDGLRSQPRRINTAQMLILPQVIYRINAIKIPRALFTETEKAILTFMQKHEILRKS